MSPKYIMGKQHSVNQGNEVLGCWLLSCCKRQQPVKEIIRPWCQQNDVACCTVLMRGLNIQKALFQPYQRHQAHLLL